MQRPVAHGEPMVRPVVLLQLTDPHLYAMADCRLRGVNTNETFAAVLADAQRSSRWPPDAVLVTGDIVQDESRAGYQRFRAMLEPLGLPVYSIPGNHDDPRLLAELAHGGRFQVCGEARFGGWSLILLSTHLTGEDAGGLGEKRLHALAAALTAHRDNRVLIVMHHHALPVGSAWLDGVGLRDAPAFLELIDAHPHVRAVLCGHTHQASDCVRRGVRFITSPSTCSQFAPGSDRFMLDERPPGMRWLALHADGLIETEVQWVDSHISSAR